MRAQIRLLGLAASVAFAGGALIAGRQTDVRAALTSAGAPPAYAVWLDSLDLAKMEQRRLGVSGPRVVRDLWRQRDLGTIDRQFTVRVPAHGAVMFRVRKP